jgi:hypothetical protein
VKSFTRGLGIAVLGLGLLGVAGCGPDNEAEATKLAKDTPDPGPANPKAIPDKSAAPVEGGMEAFGRRSQEASRGAFKKGAYPGAK